jgi:hypothetical protein
MLFTKGLDIVIKKIKFPLSGTAFLFLLIIENNKEIVEKISTLKKDSFRIDEKFK